MATVTEVTLGRIGHYRITRLHPDTSATEAAECECGATWHHADNETYDGFCDWVLRHPAPKITQAEVRCAGSGGLIRVEAVGRNGDGWCPKCERYRPTTPAAGYEGWRFFDSHAVLVEARP